MYPRSILLSLTADRERAPAVTSAIVVSARTDTPRRDLWRATARRRRGRGEALSG